MRLLRLMLREEYRLHISYSSARMFLAMPLFVFLISLATSLTLRNLQGSIDLEDMMVGLNAGICLYGMSVGALGFMGRTYVERRQGKYNYLVAMPALLPMSYRSTFLGMYVRDIIFYMALILGPAALGLAVAAPLVGYSWSAVLSVSIALILSFLSGISLSFAVSVIGSRSRTALFVLVGAIISVLIGFGVFHLYGMEAFLPSIGFQMSLPPFGLDQGMMWYYLAISIASFLALSAVAFVCVAETYDGEVKRKAARQDVLPSYLRRFAFARSYRPLLAKEAVDLVRSGTIGKISFTFIAPLTFLSFSTWYVNNGLNVPVGFNLVFYASMVGFFGVMLYSWLTNMDAVDYFETLPVSPQKLIRSKLMMFLLLTTGISTTFVLALALLNDETRLLWLALPVLYVTSAYMVVSMSYLTGLHPNSYLFNPQVLFRFALISMLPQIGLTILSFSVDSSPAVTVTAILAVLGVLIAVTLFLNRRLDRRWSNTGF
jgi:MFS family permease